MKKFSYAVVFLFLLSSLSVSRLWAGPPFNNLEGVGGVAFNPLAWLADSSGDNSHLKAGDTDILGKPRFGVWYVNLNQNQPNIDWTSWGVAESFLDRLELSYGYETVAFKGGLPTTYKHDLKQRGQAYILHFISFLANARSFATFALILVHWFPTAENPTPILSPISFKLNPDFF